MVLYTCKYSTRGRVVYAQHSLDFFRILKNEKNIPFDANNIKLSFRWPEGKYFQRKKKEMELIPTFPLLCHSLFLNNSTFLFWFLLSVSFFLLFFLTSLTFSKLRVVRTNLGKRHGYLNTWFGAWSTVGRYCK